MQDDSGLKRVFTISWIYQQFQILLGANYGRKWFVENVWNVKSGDKVVDIGCGTGDIRDLFPEDVSYVGFDISEKYIKAAQKKYGKRAKFIVGTAHDFLQKPDENNLDSADLVLCVGLLHHLDNNDALDVLQLAKKIMKNSGRFKCFEPTFLIHQGSLPKWIMPTDRGRNIRTGQEWKALIGQAFDTFSTNIATGLNRMYYIHMVIECRKNV